jgi:hypothetical protein
MLFLFFVASVKMEIKNICLIPEEQEKGMWSFFNQLKIFFSLA